METDDPGGLCPACIFEFVVDGSAVAGQSSGQRGRGLLHLADHVVHEEIARGGMGIVYRATQLEPRREVALKMLLPHQVASPGMLERFRLEARAIATLEHPAILPVHHVGEHETVPFFTMKLATGGTLAERKQSFSGNWRAIAELVARLADAVQFAHERGVLHRDLKPGNVLFDSAGRAYVSDFGLAKLVNGQSDLTRSVELLGTPHYVAPEIAAGSARDATTASDIYSLGAILYELLAGQPPFQAESVPALLKKIAEEEPAMPRVEVRPSAQEGRESSVTLPTSHSAPRRSQLGPPRDLTIICLKCLAKNPLRRYATARELGEDLRRWLEGFPILARPAAALERITAWARRNPAVATLATMLALVLIAALLLQMNSNRRLKQAIAESLVKQARLERSSGRPGQRFETLAGIDRAAAHLRGSRDAASTVVVLRSEVAAALALPDVRTAVRWPVHVAHFENQMEFNAALDRYITAAPDGGFTVFSLPHHKVLRQVPGTTNNPAVELGLSGDGGWAAARFQDGHAELHSVATDQVPHRWPGMRGAAIFAFATAADRFAVAPSLPGQPRIVEVVNLPAGRVEATLPGGDITTLAFDDAARHIATAGRNLSVWRLAETNQLWSTPLSHEASAIAWSRDGRRLAVALDRRWPTGEVTLRNDPVLIFDARTGRQEFVFAENSSRTERLAFHANNQWLAAATWDGLVVGAARPDGLRLKVEAAPRALAFSRDGSRLGYAPSKEELGLLEVVVPTALREWRMISPPAAEGYMLAHSADGRLVVSATGNGLQLWDAEARSEIDAKALPGTASWVQVLFGPGDQFVYYSAETFGIRRVELVRGTAPGEPGVRFGAEQMLGEPRGFMALGLVADGPALLVGEYRRHARNDRLPPAIWLWPDGTPAQPRKLVENFPLVGYRVLPGEEWAVSADLVAPDAWIWNFKTGERVRNLGLPTRVSSEPVANGRWLVTRTRTEYVVWEVGSWRPIARWASRADEQGGGTTRASPDSRMLLSRTPGGRFILRELPGGREIMMLMPPQPMTVISAMFSPDSNRVIMLLRSGQVAEWNVAAIRRELARLHLDWRANR